MRSRRSIRLKTLTLAAVFALAASSLCGPSTATCGPAGAADLGFDLSAVANVEQKAKLRERLKSNVLRWGGDAEGGAPYQYYEAARPQELVGFEVDLVAAVVAQLRKQYDLPDLQPKFVQYEWVSLPQGLEKQDFDVIISGMEITSDNLVKMRFTRPYYLFAQQLAVRSALKPGEKEITSLEDCRERIVGTMAGSAAYEYLGDRGFTKIAAYDGQIEPYLELGLDRVDAVLLDSPIAAYVTKSRPNLKLVGLPEGWGGYGIAAAYEDAELTAALDLALNAVVTSGQAEAIYKKWKMWGDEQQRLASFDTPQKLIEWSETQSTGEEREWTFKRYAPLLLSAAWVTIQLSVESMAVAMTIGLLVAVCRLFGPAPVRLMALVYVELFRGIPLLLLLTFLYYGFPTIGIRLTAWEAAIIGFGLNYAAFEAEIYRSSILGVPHGQWEASQALGMEGTTTFRRIIFPQAIRTALGPMTNDFVAMFKDTSLVSVIAVVELTKQYQLLARTSLKFVELGLLTAALYLAMSVPLGYLARYLEGKWSGGAGK